MSRTLITAALGVAVLAFSASAALFTTHLDQIQIAVEQAQEELPDKLTRAQKKEASAYKSVLKKLSKDSVTIKTDLKIAKSTLKLEKLPASMRQGHVPGPRKGFRARGQRGR